MARWVMLCACLVLSVAVVTETGVAHKRVIKGKAVYYAARYDGSKMACGGRYRPRKLVAAHRSLPCGTRLKVRNVRTGDIVKVTVRDRGPYGDSRTVLDLSRRAARKLGYLRAGRARVRATVVHY
jgi:rare lipoprotein A